ncbi:MASE4 domain-containing protein [Paenibacillaceae sp. P-4]|uniref:MASE4 domain-containing protein n=1 Tax=Paenibacillaceae bacterium P-4 TaxID=3160969 RepID=UPI0032E84C20
MPTVSKQKWKAMIIGSVMLVFALLVLPYASMPLWKTAVFFPVFIAWILFGNLLTSHLLYIQFHATRHKPVLILSATFLFTGLIMIPHMLTSPGVFAEEEILDVSVQTSMWFWVCWHVGYPAGIILYTSSLRKKNSRSSVRHEYATAIKIFAIVIVLVGLITYVLIGYQDVLPVLIQDEGYQQLIPTGVGPIVWSINFAACLFLFLTTRGKSLLHLWLLVSVFTFFLDVTLAIFSDKEFSLGWYVACLNSLLSATAVLFVFFYQVNRLYVRLIYSQKALRNSQERVVVILDSITDAFLAVDKQWCYTYMNKEAEKYLGFIFGVVKGLSIWKVSPHLHQTKLYEICHQVMYQGQPREFTEFDKMHGRWLEYRVFPSRNGVSVYFHDVTERIVAEKQMKEANKKLQMANRLLTDFSYTDGLTGVYNRRYFDQIMNQEWERVKKQRGPLSLIMLDVDYFKRYNDTYGHLAGDECLHQVAQAIREVVTPPLAVVARYGGEEFGVILPLTDLMTAKLIGEQIRVRVESLGIPHADSDASHVVTCSLGAASCSIEDVDDSEPHMLVARADQELYRAKQGGRNRLIVAIS